MELCWAAAKCQPIPLPFSGLAEAALVFGALGLNVGSIQANGALKVIQARG